MNPHPTNGHVSALDVGPSSDERTGVTLPPNADGIPSGDTGNEAFRVSVSTRPAVRFAVAPPSRLWIAGCLGLGGAFVLLAAFRSLGALLLSFEHRALEALFLP